MALWTTYLSFITRHRNEIMLYLHERSFNPATAIRELYLMRNRGNNAVAPSKDLLEWFLRMKKLFGDEWEARGKIVEWPEYKKRYLAQLETEEAIEWMKHVAELSKNHEVILVCYEKDWRHCHRYLLAKTIEEKFGVKYEGEIEEMMKRESS